LYFLLGPFEQKYVEDDFFAEMFANVGCRAEGSFAAATQFSAAASLADLSRIPCQSAALAATPLRSQ
jgi:hypothetical protein